LGANTLAWLTGYFSDVRANNTGARVNLSSGGALQTGATVKLDWSGTDLSVNSRKITNVNDPTAAQDVATKAYADTKLANPHTPTGFWSQMPTFPNQLNYFIKEYDFFPNVVATNFVGDFLSSASGTGAAYQLSDKSVALAGIDSTEKATGVCYLNLGTAASTRIFLGFGSNNVASFSFGQHETIWGTRANLATLSDGTNTYTAYHGFMESVTAGPVQGAFFRYTHSVNGGRWEFCVANGSVTAADTGVSPSAGVYQVFEIKINRAATSITFYIDGSLVGTVTTGIPTAGLFPGTSLIRTAGTSGNYGSYIDAVYAATERLSAR
jgi:hypothetical protein